MTGEPPLERETGLPGQQGEFAIALPWIGRLVLTMAIGAVVGFAFSTVLAANSALAPQHLVIATGAFAAAIMSIRRVHGWHVSTFVDGTLAGLAAAPIFWIVKLVGIVTARGNIVSFEGVKNALLVLMFSFVMALVTVPCGWLAGFAYHLLLSASQRRRTAKDEPDLG